MYIPGINRFEDQEEIFRFIKENPFAILIQEIGGTLHATHMPVELEFDAQQKPLLRAHLARANPQSKAMQEQVPVLVIFNGPHTYISSSWYDHMNVPTWNYVAVHVYGVPSVLTGDDAIALLRRLTDRYEQFSEKPFHIDDLSQEYMESHMQALTAFEITPDRIEAKKKLSQNRDRKNFDHILDKLGEREDEQSKAVKQEMEKIKEQIKGKNKGQ